MNTDYKNNIKRNIIVSILVNGVLPLITYKLLINHVPSITALIISTTIPIIDNVYHIIKDKKIDILATFVILGFVIGIISMFFSGNERLLLIRQSYITGIMGIVFLVSMLFPKPIIYYFADRYLNPPNKNNQERNKKSVLEEKWKNPRFRFSMKFITFIWGICLVLEAICNITLVFTLSISNYLAVSPFVSYGFMGFALFITFSYRKRIKNRIKENSTY